MSTAALVITALVVGIAIGSVLASTPPLLDPPPISAEGLPPTPGPTVEVDEVMALAALASLTTALNYLGDHARTRKALDDMKDPALQAVFVAAAVHAIVRSDEMTARVRAMADQMVADRLWSMPEVPEADR